MHANTKTAPARSWTSHPVIALLAGASLLLAFLAAPDMSGAESVETSTSGSSASLPDPFQSVTMRADIKAAVSTFVWAISNHQAPAVWHFASEDHQASLETEAAALSFFARIHPQIANARQMRFDGLGFDDDGAHATVYILDTKGLQWLARFDVEQDPVGDWKIIGCEVRLAPGDLA